MRYAIIACAVFACAKSSVVEPDTSEPPGPPPEFTWVMDLDIGAPLSDVRALAVLERPEGRQVLAVTIGDETLRVFQGGEVLAVLPSVIDADFLVADLVAPAGEQALVLLHTAGPGHAQRIVFWDGDEFEDFSFPTTPDPINSLGTAIRVGERDVAVIGPLSGAQPRLILITSGWLESRRADPSHPLMHVGRGPGHGGTARWVDGMLEMYLSELFVAPSGGPARRIAVIRCDLQGACARHRDLGDFGIRSIAPAPGTLVFSDSGDYYLLPKIRPGMWRVNLEDGQTDVLEFESRGWDRSLRALRGSAGVSILGRLDGESFVEQVRFDPRPRFRRVDLPREGVARSVNHRGDELWIAQDGTDGTIEVVAAPVWN